MKLKLKRIEEPFVLELSNETGHKCILDANEKIGGKDKGFRPMELLAGSLAACATIDVIMILEKQRFKMIDYKVEISGQRMDKVPSAFETIDLIFFLDKDVDREKATRAIELALNKYCSVSASLNDQIKINFQIQQ